MCMCGCVGWWEKDSYDEGGCREKRERGEVK